MERWRPILGVESIILSVISMLSDPNDESPANIDAAVRHIFFVYKASFLLTSFNFLACIVSYSR
jgi:hypothetical protein